MLPFTGVADEVQKIWAFFLYNRVRERCNRLISKKWKVEKRSKKP